jgi:diguanylate cyclase (GGDEF)-like protein
VKFKETLQVYDILGEGSLALVLIMACFIIARLYKGHRSDRSWLLLLCGMAVFSCGSVIDLLDEFIVLPNFVPHGIEKLVSAAGAVLLAIGSTTSLDYLVKASRTDASTGLRNRRYFIENLQRRMTIDPEGAFSLVFLDARRWGMVDEESMRQIGLNLVSLTRANDMVARFSGTVFAVTVPGDDSEGLLRLRNRVIESIEGNECDLICSGVGMASYPKDGKNIEGLLDTIERRMYGPAIPQR